MAMRVLFIGDVVGPRAVDWLASRLPGLRAEHAVDLAVVNAENCGADAASMTVEAVEQLLAAGADVITGGNHAFEGAEVEAVLGHERVLRPLNVSERWTDRSPRSSARTHTSRRCRCTCSWAARLWSPRWG
jgi:calcineurin-like phosphoesterase